MAVAVSESVLEKYANEISKTVVIRTEHKGCSLDTRRRTTPEEQTIIKNLIFAALLAVNSGADKRSAADTAELAVNLFLRKTNGVNGVNGYDSVFRPIMEFDFSR